MPHTWETTHAVPMLWLLLVFAVAFPAMAAGGIDAMAKAENKRLVYRSGGQTIVIEAWGPDGLRVRVTPTGGKQTSDWALDIPAGKDGRIEITPAEATIRNGKVSARIRDIYTQRGHLQFFRHVGDKAEPILTEYDYGVWANNPGTRVFRPVGDGLFHCEVHFEAREGERFYGLGENGAPRLNLKGAVIDLYQRHVKAVIPFVVSSANMTRQTPRLPVIYGASGRRITSISAYARSGSIRQMNSTISRTTIRSFSTSDPPRKHTATFRSPTRRTCTKGWSRPARMRW